MVTAMNREKAWRDLATAERLLAEGEARIERQRDIIRRLQRNRSDISTACDLLRNLIEAHERHQQRLDTFRRWLETTWPKGAVQGDAVGRGERPPNPSAIEPEPPDR